MRRRLEKRSGIKNGQAEESIPTMLASEDVLKKELGNKADEKLNDAREQKK